MISCKFSECPFELCRKRAFNRAKKALFRGRAEIEIFGDIFTSACTIFFQGFLQSLLLSK